MNGPLRLLKIVQWKQLKGVIGFFFRHPFLLLSALPATWQCVGICDHLFGNTHHKHNKANAFRHALWNMLLMRNALKTGSSLEDATKWAQEFTDWHEDFSPNKEPARSMDFHNNAVGRLLYREKFNMKRVKNIQITQALLPLLEKAVLTENIEEVRSTPPTRLVFLKA